MATTDSYTSHPIKSGVSTVLKYRKIILCVAVPHNKSYEVLLRSNVCFFGLNVTYKTSEVIWQQCLLVAVVLWPMCCHTGMPCRRHRTWHPTPSQYTDTRPTCHCAIHWCGTSHWNTELPILMSWVMPLAHYYDVDRELHELKHRGELVPTRNEIMGKLGASMLLSYSGLVVSYATREGLGFARVLHSRVVVSSCRHRRAINTIPESPLFAACILMKKNPLSRAIALSSYWAPRATKSFWTCSKLLFRS